MQRIEGTSKPSRDGGGTKDALPKERAKGSFNVAALTDIIEGGADIFQRNKEWRKLFDPSVKPEFDFTYDAHLDRGEAIKKSVGRTLAAHKIVKVNQEMKATHMGGGFGIGNMVQSGPSAAGNHYGIFVGGLQAQASDAQKREWFLRAINLKILGAYGQTELGHGSNVRGLETTATYDVATEEFIIDTPQLTSMKWWPGCFGLLATHAIVYARLIIKGKDHGIHSFMVQLRDENFKAMPGIEVGDVGPKPGYNLVDNGFCRIDNVRVRRENMLNRFQHVTKEGEYVKHKLKSEKDDSKAGAKIGYIVMIATRVSMVRGAYRSLAAAATVAIRYSAVRKQGFVDTRVRDHKQSLVAGETSVLDYQVQQYRLFKWLSFSYAIFFVSKEVQAIMSTFQKGLASGDVSALPELHATAAGLKAFCTNWVGDGMEECRRCCGGHGSTLSSGIAKHTMDYITIGPIAEGDKIVLALQTARFLVRCVQGVKKAEAAGQKAMAASMIPGAAKYLAEDEPRFNLTNVSSSDSSHLLEAFKWRAWNSARVATNALDARIEKGEVFDQAWNNCAVSLVKAAEHHCFYVMVKSFFTAATSATLTTDASVRRTLSVLATHFALVQLRENGADWVASGRYAGTTATDLDAAIAHCLATIRPDAVSLVDAFNFTDNSLQSAIGRFDGNVYEALYDYAKKNPLNRDEYVQDLFNSELKGVLDLEYLKTAKQKQRHIPTRGRL